MVIPLVLLVFKFDHRRQKTIDNLFDRRILSSLIPDYFRKYQFYKNLIVILIIIFNILALTNPQFSNKREIIKSKTSDIYIALDISKSMRSQDISPDRLEYTKKVIEDLIYKLKGDRIGLIFFAGDAFLKMPLSLDYSAAILNIRSASPDQIENQGTSLNEAFNIAQKSLKDDNHKAMILFSDGEDHEGNALEGAKMLKSHGVTLYTVSVGTDAGGYIPETDEFGVETYKKDENGKYLKSKPDRALLDKIASIGGGFSFDISDNNLPSKLSKRLENLEKRELIQKSFIDYQSYYYYFGFISLILMLLYFFIPEILKRK